MNIKLKIALLSILIAVVIIAPVLLLTQNGTQNGNETKIQVSDFNWTEDWIPCTGVTAMRGFNVTVQNLGTNDVENLKFEVKMINNGTTVATGFMLNGTGDHKLGSFGLRGGQVCTFRGIFLAIWWSWGGVIVVDVRLADVIVGELKVDYYYS